MISLMTLNDFEYVDQKFKAHLQDSLYCQKKRRNFLVGFLGILTTNKNKSPVKKWIKWLKKRLFSYFMIVIMHRPIL